MSRPRPAAVKVALLGPLTLMTLLYLGSILGLGRDEPGFSALWDGWICNIILFLAAVSCLVRGYLHRATRWVSWWFAAGIAVWSAGNLIWTVSVRVMEDPPYPSWADAGYLAFYPPVVAGVLLTSRRVRERRRDPVVVFDGLVGGFSGAAGAAVFALGPIARSATGSRSAIITNLAYPVGDTLLLTLLLTVAGLAGWRLTGRQVALMVSLAVFAVADSIYLVRVATDSYEAGTILDACWVLPIVGLAWAQWIDDRQDANAPRPAHGRAVWVPLCLIASALLVCGWYAWDALPPIATMAMAAALGSAGLRMVVTVRQMEQLAGSERQARENEIRVLAQARDEITRANAALEERVQERTADLAAANQRLSATADRLRQSNRELQDFAYVASHDLQEPLRKVQAFGSRLADRHAAELNAEGQDYVARMQGAARRMSTLIEDLLTFSRVSTAGGRMQEIDVARIAHDVISDLEIAVEQSDAVVHVGPLPIIEADPTQIRQLLQNLVGNAVKFRRPGVQPEIFITGVIEEGNHLPEGSRASGPCCRLEVTDNGIGFDEQYLDRIFTVFQRLHGRDEYPGSGVGLAVCRRIVERHHGVLTATSNAGIGSRFTALLPIRQPKEVDHGAPVLESAHRAG